ncbi:MAG: hypothetical protein R2854_04455 [Caldilineaceae bacterium]
MPYHTPHDLSRAPAPRLADAGWCARSPSDVDEAALGRELAALLDFKPAHGLNSDGAATCARIVAAAACTRCRRGPVVDGNVAHLRRQSPMNADLAGTAALRLDHQHVATEMAIFRGTRRPLAGSMSTSSASRWSCRATSGTGADGWSS